MAFTEKGLAAITNIIKNYEENILFSSADVGVHSATLTSLVKDGYLFKKEGKPMKYFYTNESKKKIEQDLPKQFAPYSEEEFKVEYNLSYDELVSYLINKYGIVSGSYFCTPEMKSQNTKITRGKESLIVHHIYEKISIMLCNPSFAIDFPWEYQLGENLVYCNIIEHCLLHMKIVDMLTASKINKYGCFPGIGGIINFILPKIRMIVINDKVENISINLFTDYIKNWLKDFYNLEIRHYLSNEEQKIIKTAIKKRDIKFLDAFCDN